MAEKVRQFLNDYPAARWAALILIALFGVGYFLGSVDNKEAFLKETVPFLPDAATFVMVYD